MKTYYETAIPFPGYYETLYSTLFDRAEEMLCEDGYNIDSVIDAIDYASAKEDINKVYVDCLNDILSSIDGLDIADPLTYKEMISPREYNFSTDRLFCKISERDLLKLFAFVIEHHKEDFRAILEQQFTPRSGFIPFYSKDLKDWLEKSVLEYDHNEIRILIETALCADYDPKKYEFEEDIFDSVADYVSGNGTIDEHINESVLSWRL